MSDDDGLGGAAAASETETESVDVVLKRRASELSGEDEEGEARPLKHSRTDPIEIVMGGVVHRIEDYGDVMSLVRNLTDVFPFQRGIFVALDSSCVREIAKYVDAPTLRVMRLTCCGWNDALTSDAFNPIHEEILVRTYNTMGTISSSRSFVNGLNRNLDGYFCIPHGYIFNYVIVTLGGMPDWKWYDMRAQNIKKRCDFLESRNDPTTSILYNIVEFLICFMMKPPAPPSVAKIFNQIRTSFMCLLLRPSFKADDDLRTNAVDVIGSCRDMVLGNASAKDKMFGFLRQMMVLRMPLLEKISSFKHVVWNKESGNGRIFDNMDPLCSVIRHGWKPFDTVLKYAGSMAPFCYVSASGTRKLRNKDLLNITEMRDSVHNLMAESMDIVEVRIQQLNEERKVHKSRLSKDRLMRYIEFAGSQRHLIAVRVLLGISISIENAFRLVIGRARATRPNETDLIKQGNDYASNVDLMHEALEMVDGDPTLQPHITAPHQLSILLLLHTISLAHVRVDADYYHDHCDELTRGTICGSLDNLLFHRMHGHSNAFIPSKSLRSRNVDVNTHPLVMFERFGVQPGWRMETPLGKGTIVGFWGGAELGNRVYYAIDNDGGGASHWSEDTDRVKVAKRSTRIKMHEPSKPHVVGSTLHDAMPSTMCMTALVDLVNRINEYTTPTAASSASASHDPDTWDIYCSIEECDFGHPVLGNLIGKEMDPGKKEFDAVAYRTAPKTTPILAAMWFSEWTHLPLEQRRVTWLPAVIWILARHSASSIRRDGLKQSCDSGSLFRAMIRAKPAKSIGSAFSLWAADLIEYPNWALKKFDDALYTAPYVDSHLLAQEARFSMFKTQFIIAHLILTLRNTRDVDDEYILAFWNSHAVYSIRSHTEKDIGDIALNAESICGGGSPDTPSVLTESVITHVMDTAVKFGVEHMVFITAEIALMVLWYSQQEGVDLGPTLRRRAFGEITACLRHVNWFHMIYPNAEYGWMRRDPMWYLFEENAKSQRLAMRNVNDPAQPLTYMDTCKNSDSGARFHRMLDIGNCAADLSLKDTDERSLVTSAMHDGLKSSIKVTDGLLKHGEFLRLLSGLSKDITTDDEPFWQLIMDKKVEIEELMDKAGGEDWSMRFTDLHDWMMKRVYLPAHASSPPIGYHIIKFLEDPDETEYKGPISNTWKVHTVIASLVGLDISSRKPPAGYKTHLNGAPVTFEISGKNAEKRVILIKRDFMCNTDAVNKGR